MVSYTISSLLSGQLDFFRCEAS